MPVFEEMCPFLERVSISRSLELESVEIIETFPSFKWLEISSCQNLRSVVVRDSKVACINLEPKNVEDEMFARAHAKDQLTTYIPSQINVKIL